MKNPHHPDLHITAMLRATRYGTDAHWVEHVPFLFWLVDALQPRVIADLGRTRTELCIPLCEAAQSLNPCHVHVGSPTEDARAPSWVDAFVQTVPTALLNQMTVHVGDVTELIEAIGPDTIDLLHVDATEEAATGPLVGALSARAVVVSHQPQSETSTAGLHPVFEFSHAGGLSISSMGTEPPEALRRLAALSPDDSIQVRTMFERLGSAIRTGVLLRESQRTEAQQETELERLRSANADLTRERDRLVAAVEQQLRASQANAEAAQAHARVAQANAEAARRSEELLEHIYRSRSWRITRPLRTRPSRNRAQPSAEEASRWDVPNDRTPPQEGDLSAAELPTNSTEDDPWAAEIRASRLVDEAWYLARYPEVAAAGCDPVLHQLGHYGPQGLGWGGLADQDPNPWFDSRWYRARYGDDLAPGRAPLLDYLRASPEEDRDPSVWFDSHWFREHRDFADESADHHVPALVQFQELGQPREHCFPGRLMSMTRIRVVFLSGLPDHPGHRYRVLDAAAALPPDVYEVFVLALNEWPARRWVVANADLLWIWRAPMSGPLDEIVAYARSFGARVIVDVDDLIFDDSLTAAEVDGLRSQRVDQAEQAEQARLMRETMARSDLIVTPTRSLAQEARSFGFKAAVLPNGHDIAFARAAVEAKSRRGLVHDRRVRVGYATGSKTHQKDLAVAAGALAAVLAANRHVLLVLYRGAIDLSEFPEFDSRVDAQIEWREPVPLEHLPFEYARFDVNIAPLEVNNRFCESKSALKFNEAALVAVPTVASPTGPYQEAISPGVNGFLASSPEEWASALNLLISDAKLRHSVGERARLEALWRYGPETRTRRMRHVVESTLAAALPTEPAEHSRPCTPLGAWPATYCVPRADLVQASPSRVTVALVASQNDAVECLREVPPNELRSLDLLILEPPGGGSAPPEWDNLTERMARAAVIPLPNVARVRDLAEVAAHHVRTEWILWLPAHSVLSKEGVKRLLQIADATLRPIVTPGLLRVEILDGVELLAAGELADMSLVSTALASRSTAVLDPQMPVDAKLWDELERAFWT